MSQRLTLKLWLHREEKDAWLVSLSGTGAGVYLPKAEIEIEDGHPVPVLTPVGPVSVDVPAWLAERERLAAQPDPRQGEMDL